MGIKGKTRKGAEKQEKEKKEEKKAKRGRQKWWVVAGGAVGAGTGNVLGKYFQSCVMCFLSKAYGPH